MRNRHHLTLEGGGPRPLQLGLSAHWLLKGRHLAREDRAGFLALALFLLSLLELLGFQPDSQLKEWPRQETS